MKQIKIVQVGIGGYGATYTGYYKDALARGDDSFKLEGIVDPYAAKGADYAWAVEQGLPIYNTLEEFYAEHAADLATIATPIQLHREQCVTAMRHGSNVLVEKPLCPTIQDAEILQRTCNETGKFLAVGFQWSFSKPILDLKRDILAGRFGKPVGMRGFVSWQRYLSYYNHTWKGRYRDGQGRWILDSVITNATAHYLHNLFFIAGTGLDEAAMPTRVLAESYKVKPDMLTPDVFVLRGELPGDVPFWFASSYSLAGDTVTTFEFRYEHAVVRFNIDENDDTVRAQLNDGSEIVYGNPQSSDERSRKIRTCIAAADDPSVQLTCTIKTILPHLNPCNGMFDLIPPQPVDARYLVEQHDTNANDTGIFAKTLRDGLLMAYGEGKLPSELGYSWSKPAVVFNPGTITEYQGTYAV